MLLAIIIITGLFFTFLGLKRLLPKLCALCLAVSATWVIGLALSFEPIILALLMGGSAVGLMYYLASVLPKKFEIFKLPFLLTIFALFLFILKTDFDLITFVTLIGIWCLFGILHLLRNGLAKSWFKKVVECCKNW